MRWRHAFFDDSYVCVNSERVVIERGPGGGGRAGRWVIVLDGVRVDYTMRFGIVV